MKKHLFILSLLFCVILSGERLYAQSQVIFAPAGSFNQGAAFPLAGSSAFEGKDVQINGVSSIPNGSTIVGVQAFNGSVTFYTYPPGGNSQHTTPYIVSSSITSANFMVIAGITGLGLTSAPMPPMTLTANEQTGLANQAGTSYCDNPNLDTRGGLDLTMQDAMIFMMTGAIPQWHVWNLDGRANEADKERQAAYLAANPVAPPTSAEIASQQMQEVVSADATFDDAAATSEATPDVVPVTGDLGTQVDEHM